MRHYLAVVFFIYNSKNGKRRNALFFGYLKIILRAYLYHKIQKHFYSQRPPYFSIRVMGYRIRFMDHSFLLHLFEEIFIREIYFFQTSHTSPFIVDCGSNIGLSLLYFEMKYPKSRILAFEPDAANFSLLSKNIEMNQLEGITLKMSALSKEKSERPFFSSASEAGALNNSLFQLPKHNTAVLVNTEKLSDHISEKVDWLKIDTEGAEGEIIEDLCSSNKIDMINALFIEYHNQCQVPLSTIETLLGNAFTRTNVLTGSPDDQKQMVFKRRSRALSV
jgi:FkbM family methyltransferase